MERLTEKELHQADEKYINNMNAICAPVISEYKKMMNASFYACKNALIHSHETGQGAVSHEARKACWLTTGKKATYLELKCQSRLYNALGVTTTTLDRTGDDYNNPSVYMTVDITNAVMPESKGIGLD